MSKPDNAETQDLGSNTSVPEQTYEVKVNNLVATMTQDEGGKWGFPADTELSEDLQFSAMSERRRRDTESAYGATRHKLKIAEGTNAQLTQRLAASTSLEIPAERAEELEQLKFDSPELWRQELNKLEVEATTNARNELATISTAVSQQTELERRTQVLTDFNASAAVPITDEVLANDVPPRITKKLENGEITFEEFLASAQAYLVTPKKVADVTVEAQPNLGSVGGSDRPSGSAQQHTQEDGYETQSF